jgi:uncharacterized protein YegL
MEEVEDVMSVEEFASNPTPRLPVALVLDTSGSMQGEPIQELNDGLQLFLDEIYNDEYARSSAEICIITFGGVVNVVQDFAPVTAIQLEPLTAGGETPMGTAVLTALEKLEARKSLYKELGIDYYQPWMVLMTDGLPTDSISEASRRTQELISNKKLVVFPIAIGPNASLEELSKFTTPNRPPLRMKEHSFREFFLWLSKSVSVRSRSTPGEKTQLADGIDGWRYVE